MKQLFSEVFTYLNNKIKWIYVEKRLDKNLSVICELRGGEGLEKSNIETYIETADFKEDKMLAFIFRGMCEAKEEREQRPLTIQELGIFKQNLQARMRENKFTINDCFNLVLAYRFTEYEKASGKRLKPREKIFYASELARELGVEDSISQMPYILAPRDGKIAPTDKRIMLGHSIASRIKYKKMFRQMADGNKITIKSFSMKMLRIPPKAKRQMAIKAASMILMGVLLALPIDTIGMKAMNASNALVYAKQIEDYETRMNNYANELRNMNLTDLQLIMKVMDDMHSNIKGYDNPEIDAIGLWRLDAGNSSSTGVCRNMADNVTYILNQVNPNYNARNMFVRMNTSGIDIADVDRKINFEYADNLERQGERMPGFIANHAITVFDVPTQNYSLVVDPTNPAIGVLADGNIIMLNDMQGKMTYTPISELMYGMDYHLGIIKNLRNMNEHSTSKDIDIEELRQQWGKEAQNRALQEVRAMPNAIQLAQNAYHSSLEYSDVKFTNKKVKQDDFEME